MVRVIAFFVATTLACGQGPNVLRLGGGIGNSASSGPAEFGSGAILELVVWQMELSTQDVWAVASYFEAT